MISSQDFENMSPAMFRKKILLSIIVPVLFITVLWLIRFIQNQFEISFYGLGIYPLEARGLTGIIFSPLIHSDADHLLNNSLPLLVLGTAIFYFYSQVAFRVIGLTWLLTGILVWLAGREAWHIGASGLVYGLASFLFVSGIIRRYIPLMALSLLVAYLYGSMVWGMFPFIYVEVSWESHMLGAATGLILALWYRHEGPQRPAPEWYDDDITEPDIDSKVLKNIEED
ncbi:MAG TPA: rhomboid family intramembrane serine protease [Bacteroidales bacterium]|nr:rhomboid family intramembrane serine protease [Bacteroidales bacterium]